MLRMPYLQTDKELSKKTDSTTSKIILYSRRRLDIVAAIINLSAVIALLIVPVYILLKVTHSSQTGPSTTLIMAILLIFTFIFTVVLALFTSAKRHEILASAAA